MSELVVVQVVGSEPEAEIIPLFLLEAAVAHRGLFPERRAEYGPDTQLKWDAAREDFIGDDEASALRDRPRRKGFELPQV